MREEKQQKRYESSIKLKFKINKIGRLLTEKAYLIEGSFRVNLSNGYLSDNRVFTERRTSHEMVQSFPFTCEPGGSIRHYSFPLCRSNLAAEVRLLGITEFTVTALWDVEGNNMVANCNGGYT